MTQKIMLPLCGALVCAQVSLAADPRPNILYIMADDHAAHAISAYGSKIVKTHNLDRIAKEGMRFENCFVVNSICTPSRAAILTGKYSHINGVTVFNRFDGEQWTVAKELQKAGYHTGMIGKWHLQSDPTGFDYWTILPGQGKYWDPEFIEMGKRHKINGYVTDIITDLSLKFLKNRPADKPFFLMCHHKAPHRPWQPDERHARLFENADIPEPGTFNDDYKNRASAAAAATMRVDRDLNKTDLKQDPPPGLSAEALKKWKYQRYMHDYLACIASVDDNVGRLLDYLEQSGLAKNTIVIYTSDQGFFLGDHDWFDKRFMYEESLRMPFLIRYPGHIKPSTVNEGMILNVDFAPTILDFAGLSAPKAVQGRSFVALTEGRKPKDWRTSMYYRYYCHPSEHTVNKHYGVRTDRYKLIYFHDLNEWELFDLKKDPHEMRSVYADPGYAKVVAELKGELQRLRAELKDHDQWVDAPPKTVKGVAY
ncbi:MAG: sulfatase [Verrucomicrobia bacterium]|nr:MAG: sulfatase [Verrucomicrobiota bacterium]